MPDGGMQFGDMTFSGGIQNFGGTNTNTQHNHAAPADQVAHLLAVVREQHPDPAFAAREVTAVEGEIMDGTPAGQTRALGRLQALAAGAGDARTVVEALAAVGVIVAAHWPF